VPLPSYLYCNIYHPKLLSTVTSVRTVRRNRRSKKWISLRYVPGTDGGCVAQSATFVSPLLDATVTGSSFGRYARSTVLDPENPRACLLKRGR